MSKRKITAVILSGGKSSRMGQDKAMMTLNGVRFTDRIASQFQQCDEILFSVRKADDFPDITIPHIVDEYPGCGPLAGIHSALKHARNPWVFVIACDTPFITADAIEQMASRIQEDTIAVIPREEDGRLHVLAGLYHKEILPVLEQQLEEGNYRVRQILQGQEVIYIPVNDFKEGYQLFRNINTIKEYKEVTIS